MVSGIYDVRLEDNVLKLSEDQVLYRDQPIQGERFKPVAFQAEHRFYNEDGKLHYEYNGRCFDVHTETMQRSRSSDTAFPRFFQSKSKRRHCQTILTCRTGKSWRQQDEKMY